MPDRDFDCTFMQKHCMFIQNMGLITQNNKSIMNEYCAYVILFKKKKKIAYRV